MSRNLKKVDHGKTLVALSHAILGKITTPAYLMQEETVTLGHIEGKIYIGSLVTIEVLISTRYYRGVDENMLWQINTNGQNWGVHGFILF